MCNIVSTVWINDEKLCSKLVSRVFEISRKLFTSRDIEVSELEGVTFPFHKHISGEGGLGPRPEEASQNTQWGGNLETETRYQSPWSNVFRKIKIWRELYTFRAQFAHLRKWTEKVSHCKSRIWSFRQRWNVGPCQNRLRRKFIICIFTRDFFILNFKHESICRGKWEIWLPHPLSRQKNQSLDGEGKI